MRTKFVLPAALACLAGMWGAGSAVAEPIGATIKVVNQVTASFNRDTRSLGEGDGVNRDELIEVGTEALSELVFRDQTKLALGPGSQLKLDKFVYDPEKSGNSVAVNLMKGTFRFMTGVAEKPAYVIKTPTASIAVRGTVFDVFVRGDGTTWILLHEGAVAVSNQKGNCTLLDTPGRLMRVTSNGDVGIPINWQGLPGNAEVPFKDAFPFVAKPPSLDPRPAFTEDAVLRFPAETTNRSYSCDGKEPDIVPTPRDTAPPQKRTQQIDRDPPRAKKPVKEVYVAPPPRKKKPEKKYDDDDYEKPIKVVKVKPKRPPKNDGGNYGDKDENVKQMDGIGIAIGIGMGFGGRHRGGGGGDYPKGGYGR